ALALTVSTDGRRCSMLRNLAMMMVAVAGLSIAAAGSAGAQRMGAGATADLSSSRMQTVSVHRHASATTRAHVRGPEFRPHGWSEGRKVGWHCRVGTRGCTPPGLR